MDIPLLFGVFAVVSLCRDRIGHFFATFFEGFLGGYPRWPVLLDGGRVSP